jgi:hypothetical protein
VKTEMALCMLNLALIIILLYREWEHTKRANSVTKASKEMILSNMAFATKLMDQLQEIRNVQTSTVQTPN